MATNQSHSGSQLAIDLLAGSGCVLWREARALIDQKDVAGLKVLLEGWRKQLDQVQWHQFGLDYVEAARCRATALIEVHDALGQLLQQQWTAAWPHLFEACWNFERSFGTSTGGLSTAPAEPNLRGTSGQPAQSVECYLQALEGRFGATSVGVAMVRSALACQFPELLGDAEWLVSLRVLFVRANIQGEPRTLQLELFKRQAEGQVSFPDPSALGCTMLGPKFREACIAAWEFASYKLPRRCYVRWRIEPLGDDNFWLQGASAGGVFAAGLLGVARKLTFDPGVALTATVDAKGNLGGVGFVQAKFKAAVEEEGLARFVLCPEDESKFQHLKDRWVGHIKGPTERMRREAIEIHSAATVEDALPHLTGIVRELLNFLNQLVVKGLSKHLIFCPESVPINRLADDFCLPTKVIDEREWEKLEERRRKAVNDKSYSLLGSEDIVTSEEMLRWNHDLEVHPRRLEQLYDTRDKEKGFQPTILRGEPGEGKTTALWLHVVRVCRRLVAQLSAGSLSPDSPRFRVPLVLSLGSDFPIGGSSLAQLAAEEMLTTCFGSAHPEPIVTWLRKKIERGEYELCLDALDELVMHEPASVARGTTSRREWLRGELHRLEKVPVLLTTRLTADDRNLFADEPRRLRMVCLSTRDTGRFVHNFFVEAPVEDGQMIAPNRRVAEVGQRLRLSPGPRELVRLPLLLGALCTRKQAHPLEELPKTRTGLLRLGLHALLERGDRKRGYTEPRVLRNELKERILRYVAWTFYTSQPRPLEKLALLQVLEQHLAIADGPDKRTTAERLDARPAELLDEYLADGMLVPSGSVSYRFCLRSFHEYCLAGWIACESEPVKQNNAPRFRELLKGTLAGWGRNGPGADVRPFSDPGWQNIWPLATGKLNEHADWILEAFKDFIKWRASHFTARYEFQQMERCLAESPPSAQVRLALREHLIGWLHSNYLLPPKRSVCEALGALGDEPSRTALIARLVDQNTNSWVRSRCAEALGHIGDEESRTALIARLKDKDTEVQRCCAEALGLIGDAMSRAALIARHNDQHTGPEVRRICAGALGAIGDAIVRTALITRLEDRDTDPEVRSSCAEALGLISDTVSRAALISRLEDRDTDPVVRSSCAEALGHIGDEESRAALIAQLKDKYTDSKVQKICVRALRTIDDALIRTALITRLEDRHTDPEVRSSCAEALGLIGDAVSRTALISRLEDRDTDPEVRSSCAEALSRIGDAVSRAALIARLEDQNTDHKVCMTCADILGQLRAAEGRTALIARLDDQDTDREVRCLCAWALGQIGDAVSRTALIRALKNVVTPERLQKACVYALFGCGVRVDFKDGKWVVDVPEA